MHLRLRGDLLRVPGDPVSKAFSLRKRRGLGNRSLQELASRREEANALPSVG